MTWFITIPIKLGVLKSDLDYHLIRASILTLYFFLGYQKWYEFDAQSLMSFITDGPLIFWMYPVLAVSEWLVGALVLAGFWNKKLGVLGALGSVFTALCKLATSTVIPFTPDGLAASATGLPIMVGNTAFMMKDLVLLAVSFYLLKQDVARASLLTRYEEPLSHGSIVACGSFR